MKYSNPDIDSSYRVNNLGETLYNYVLTHKPKIIIEFGTLNGYSAVAMAMALHELNQGGKVVCYDLWDKYPFKHSTITQTKTNIDRYDLSNYVELKDQDFNSWIIEDFDMIHIDISNDGEKIMNALHKLRLQLISGKHILIEGGSKERDMVHWMVEHKKTPISSIKPYIDYTVIDARFPSISVITNFKK